MQNIGIYYNGTSLNDCIQDCAACQSDMIGLGPCFILQYGFDVIRTLKKMYPNICIFADAKISDAGAFESRIAFDAGANIVSVMGICNLETISDVISNARKRSCFSCIDLQGVEDDSLLLKAFSSLKPDFYLIQDKKADDVQNNCTFRIIRAVDHASIEAEHTDTQCIELLSFS